MPQHPFRPVKDCQTVARNLLSFFKKEKKIATHRESARFLLDTFEDDAKAGRQTLTRLESKLRFHILSAMYLEDRNATSSTASDLLKYPAWAPTYFADKTKKLDHLSFILPFVVLAPSGPNSRMSSGVHFWKQKENTHAFLGAVRTYHDVVSDLGIVALMEAVLESFRKWHVGFYMDVPAATLAFSFSANHELDRERIAASLCFGTKTEGDPAYWLGPGRTLLADMMAKAGLEPERVALALLGLHLLANWDRAGQPEGGYHKLKEVAVHGDPFDTITLSEVPMPFESQAAFQVCLADSNMRSLILAMSVRRERPESRKVDDIVREGITDHKLFEGYTHDPASTIKTTLEANVVKHITDRSAVLFQRLKDALATLPIDKDAVEKRLCGSRHNQGFDLFDFLEYNTLFQYVSEGVAKYFRANVAAWRTTFERVGESLGVLSILFKVHIEKKASSLDEACYVGGSRKDGFPPLALKNDFGDADLELIKARLVAREQTDPKEIHDHLVSYAHRCIVTEVLARALAKETKEVLTVKPRDLVFGQPQEESNDDETVV